MCAQILVFVQLNRFRRATTRMSHRLVAAGLFVTQEGQGACAYVRVRGRTFERGGWTSVVSQDESSLFSGLSDCLASRQHGGNKLIHLLPACLSEKKHH